MRQRDTLSLLVAGVLAAGTAQGHGLLGHIHVTGWAIENLPPGELKELFADPEVMNAALYAAAYTDSGYGVSGKYSAEARYISETTHWEPFITGFIAWMRANDPPPWTTLESRKRVAFLMGCASHGLQDEIFDSVFLAKTELHDAASQEATDPGTDGFLAMDGLLRFVPPAYIPRDAIRHLYPDVDAETYDKAVDKATTLITAAYVNDELGPAAALETGKYYAPIIPWTRANYLNPDIAGGHRTEVVPTLQYLLAIWDRLHGVLEDRAAVANYPELPRRIASVDPADPESWVTFVFGIGVLYDSVQVAWVDRDSGDAIPFELRNTRWNAAETRVIRLEPSVSLVPGRSYLVRLVSATRIDGTDAAPFEIEVQAACAGADDPACPPIDPFVPVIDGIFLEEPPVPDTDAVADAALDAEPVESAEPPEPVESESTATNDVSGVSTQPVDGCSMSGGGQGASYPISVLLGLAVALVRRSRRRLA